MKAIHMTSILLGTMLFVTGCPGSDNHELLDRVPFRMGEVVRPEIPSYRVVLSDFGAVPDGVTLNSGAFADAMSALDSAGGGHLDVPDGVWLTGPITFVDNVDLHLSDNAVVVFSDDRDLYPIVPSVFEGLDTRRCQAQLYAVGRKNISITGKGTFDGNGDSWRQVFRQKVSDVEWKRFVGSGGFVSDDGRRWFPDSSSFRGSIVSDAFNVPVGLSSDSEWESVKTYLRPVLLEFSECENILLEGPLFQNSPCWNLHPVLSRNIIIHDISVRNPWYSQNGDGLDIDSCEDVILTDSSFDVGDDAICIKSGKNEDGRRRARPCRRLVVNNCKVFHGHGGFVVGSEMSGGVSDMYVSDCSFLGTDVGLRFKSCRGRGGVVENIHIENIYMKDIVTEPVHFNLHYEGKSPAEKDAPKDEFGEAIIPVDETTPCFRNIFISKVVCNGAGRAMLFNGIPEMPIENVNISDCTISCRDGASMSFCKDVTFKNMDIRHSKGERIAAERCVNIVER